MNEKLRKKINKKISELLKKKGINAKTNAAFVKATPTKNGVEAIIVINVKMSYKDIFKVIKRGLFN